MTSGMQHTLTGPTMMKETLLSLGPKPNTTQTNPWVGRHALASGTVVVQPLVSGAPRLWELHLCHAELQPVRHHTCPSESLSPHPALCLAAGWLVHALPALRHRLPPAGREEPSAGHRAPG